MSAAGAAADTTMSSEGAYYQPSLWSVFFCFLFSRAAFDGDSVCHLGSVCFGDQISSVIEVKYLHSFTFALF